MPGPQRIQTFLTSGEEPRPELFDRESIEGGLLEADEEVTLEDPVLAAPVDLFIPDETWTPVEVHSVGRPAPIDGRTFGMSVAAVSDSEFVHNQDLFAVLWREFTNDMLYSAMGADGENVEWDARPETGTDADKRIDELAPVSTNLLDTDIEIQSFVGSIEGPAGVDFGVGIHAAGVETQGGGVIAVDTHNWPLGSIDGQPSLPVDVGEQAREFFAVAAERLDFEDAIENTTPTLAPWWDRLTAVSIDEANGLSKLWPFRVEDTSEFSIAFQDLTGCAIDVFVLSEGAQSEYAEVVENADRADVLPAEGGEAHRRVTQEYSPVDLTFFGAESGSGRAELSPGGTSSCSIERVSSAGGSPSSSPPISGPGASTGAGGFADDPRGRRPIETRRNV